MWPSLLEIAPALARLGNSRLVYDDYVRRYMHDAQVRAGGGEWSDDFVREGFRRLVADRSAGHAHAAEAIADRYIAISVDRARLYPDALPALERLAGRLRLAVISNGLARDQHRKLDALGIATRVDAVVVSEEVDLRKPDPAIFALALEAVGGRPETALYVGDNPEHDVVGARGAGMAAVWLDRGDGFFGLPHAVDARIASLEELPALLGVR